MTYGDALKKIFEAFYSDRSDDNKRFVHTDLKKAISEVPLKWRRHIWMDVNGISRELKNSVLKCSHANKKYLWQLEESDGEECQNCGCTRRKFKTEIPDDLVDSDGWEEWWL